MLLARMPITRTRFAVAISSLSLASGLAACGAKNMAAGSSGSSASAASGSGSISSASNGSGNSSSAGNALAGGGAATGADASGATSGNVDAASTGAGESASGATTGSPPRDSEPSEEAGTSGDSSVGKDSGSSSPASCRPALPAPSGNSAVVLQVDVCANRNAISEDIYGITFFWDTGMSTTDQATLLATTKFAKDVHLPVNRLGGDGTTRYNWQVDGTNAGEDWYFMAGGGSATPTPGASDDALVAVDNMVGAATILTIPIIDYIDKTASTNCSYPQSEYPNQDSYNPYVTLTGGDKCGNGKSGGKPIADTHIANHDIPNDAAIQKAWVQHLVSKFGTAASGGVRIYEMDNEPTGWPGVHFDVRPTAPSCAELMQKTTTYASTVKSVDPTAAVLGPDDIAPADVFDCMGTTNGQAYLAAMAAYEKANGIRILDYYSMHYPGCCNGDPIAAAVAHIKLHLGWIASNYPGTKLGYDEYNWGDDTTYPNALLEVDGLGLFGQSGVDLASFWGLDVTSPTATAFRLYRNYDGNGGSFGDVSVSASSSDATTLHVYAASRTADGAVTVIVVNKTMADVASALSLSNHVPAGKANVVVFSSANPASLAVQPAMAIADPGNIPMTFAANAATLVVIP
jgi:hypothetical protein